MTVLLVTSSTNRAGILGRTMMRPFGIVEQFPTKNVRKQYHALFTTLPDRPVPIYLFHCFCI